MADPGEGPGGGDLVLFWAKTKKWHKGEKPAGQVFENRAHHLPQGLPDPPLFYSESQKTVK